MATLGHALRMRFAASGKSSRLQILSRFGIVEKVSKAAHGRAMEKSKREAHHKVVRLVLPARVSLMPLYCPLRFCILLKTTGKLVGAVGIEKYAI